LTKGIVYNMRGSLEGKNIHITAKGFLVEKKIPALYKIIKAGDLKKVGTGITVPAWTSFCKYLIDKYGTEKLMEFYKRTDGIKEAGPFNVHFKDIYGEDFQIIDRAWRLYLLRYRSRPEGFVE
ncbi:MAG: hypothetical protein KAX38_08505, partial [Candidatus Krumholzibacteria bacterium]|nr:hypothetical protein [Candidatus Krumholzibacteria bacterium]